MSQSVRYAALFIDFENIYYFLHNAVGDDTDAADYIVNMIRELRSFLVSDRNEQCIVLHAYADFERIETNAQGALYLAGVETHNVLSTDHKNAADMRLCIDALETLYTRPEIETFVFMAGDRDYIPVIQHLKKHAKTVIAVAFQGNMSGDLLQNVGEESFFDAITFLPSELEDSIKRYDERRAEEIRARATATRAPVVPAEVPPALKSVEFAASRSLKEADEIRTLEILLTDYGHHQEVWVSPFLSELRRQFGHLAEFERKALISSMAAAGAVKVEKRDGEPHPYSVLVINWNHPDVQDLNPG